MVKVMWSSIWNKKKDERSMTGLPKRMKIKQSKED